MEAVLGPISDTTTPSVWTHQLRFWSRDDYYRMADVGILGPDEKTELIAGIVMLKARPQTPRHVVSIHKTTHTLEAIFALGFHVCRQSPIIIDNLSEPEPDVMVVMGSINDYPDDHPTARDVVLIVEVSDTTLVFDRRQKALLYATAGISDYWIINIGEKLLEVYRDPCLNGYQTIMRYSEADTVAPLAMPNALVRIADLLP